MASLVLLVFLGVWGGLLWGGPGGLAGIGAGLALAAGSWLVERGRYRSWGYLERDEDLVVHEFWRRDADSGDWSNPRRPQRFRTSLPRSPLSYDGQIVKIRWCVRVRAFLPRGKEVVGENVFRLGDVPPAVCKTEPGG